MICRTLAVLGTPPLFKILHREVKPPNRCSILDPPAKVHENESPVVPRAAFASAKHGTVSGQSLRNLLMEPGWYSEVLSALWCA